MIFDVREMNIAEDEMTGWAWRYRRGTAKEPGEIICESHDAYPDEVECRRGIVQARRAFGAAKFAKVVSA